MDILFLGLGLGHLGRQGAEELVLLLLGLEAPVTVLGRGVDELELNLLKVIQDKKRARKGRKKRGTSRVLAVKSLAGCFGVQSSPKHDLRTREHSYF